MPDILINFFNKYEFYDKKIFEYIEKNSMIIDINRDKNLVFIGCFPKVEKDILVGFKIILPKIVDDKTLFIWLHEYLHAISLYKKIGLEYFEDCNEEVMPVCYEKLFVLDNPRFASYYEERDNYLKNTDIMSYKIALEKRDSLVRKLKK